MVPVRSALMAVSIFMASSVSSRSPAFTVCPALTATEATEPGMGAATWVSSVGSAFSARPAVAAAARSGTRMTRGWPFSSKNSFTSPSGVVSDTVWSRTFRVLPGSSSMAISSWSAMP